MDIEVELESEDEQLFVEAANIVHDAVVELDEDLSFMACATVMLDKLEYMLTKGEDTTYALMLANQVHAEFMALMSDHGYDLSVNTVQ